MVRAKQVDEDLGLPRPEEELASEGEGGRMAATDNGSERSECRVGTTYDRVRTTYDRVRTANATCESSGR